MHPSTWLLTCGRTGIWSATSWVRPPASLLLGPSLSGACRPRALSGGAVGSERAPPEASTGQKRRGKAGGKGPGGTKRRSPRKKRGDGAERFHVAGGALSAELQRAWLHQLAAEWRAVNETDLGAALRMPVLRLDPDATVQLGSYAPTTRTLSIAAAHVWEQPWSRVLLTLRHEMAHQYVHEVEHGVPTSEGPHGPTFQRVCRRLGIPGGASTALGPAQQDPAPSGQGAAVLRRVRKLLALGASANEHEAAAAVAHATTLLLRHNLHNLHAAAPPSLEAAPYQSRRVGGSAARLPLHWKAVAGLLSDFFFVAGMWVPEYSARRGRQERALELLGTAVNLAMAAHVHDFLHAELARMWRRHCDDPQHSARGGSKREFFCGVLETVRETLDSERCRAAEEEGLVWVGDPGLACHVAARYPHTSKLGGGKLRLSPAHKAGRAAGRHVRIRPPLEQGPSRDQGHVTLELPERSADNC